MKSLVQRAMSPDSATDSVQVYKRFLESYSPKDHKAPLWIKTGERWVHHLRLAIFNRPTDRLDSSCRSSFPISLLESSVVSLPRYLRLSRSASGAVVICDRVQNELPQSRRAMTPLLSAPIVLVQTEGVEASLGLCPARAMCQVVLGHELYSLESQGSAKRV